MGENKTKGGVQRMESVSVALGVKSFVAVSPSARELRQRLRRFPGVRHGDGP